MQFVKLDIRNFLSFGEENTLRLDGQGLVLIEGENMDDPTVESNGSGKSALFEALVWGLFGKTIRDVEADAVVNEKAGQDCRVRVIFNDDVGREYVVTRHRLDKKEKNALTFTFQSGLTSSTRKDLTHTDSSVTQQKINEVLGMTFDTFVNSVVFGQGVMKHFAAMTDKEQKAIMDRIIGLESLAEAHKLAKDRVNLLVNEAASLTLGLGDDVKRIEGELESARHDRDEWGTKQADNVKYMKAKLGKVKGGDPAECILALEAAKEVLGEAEEALEGARKKSSECSGVVSAAANTLEDVKHLLAEAASGVGKCDYCGQHITQDTIEEHRKELKARVEQAQDAYDRAVEKLKDLKGTQTKLFAARSRASEKVDVAQRDLTDAKTAEAAKKLIRESIKNAEAETNPHAKRIEGLKDDLDKARAEDKAFEKKLKGTNEELKRARFIAAMFSDKGEKGGAPPLKGCILDSVTPFLNQKVAHYARFLTDGGITIKFNTQTTLKSGEVRDAFSVDAVNRHGSSVYKGNSGGEKRKIDVCIALALQALGASRNRGQVNIAFYDEVFESLDETAQEAVMELLQEEKRHKDSLFVISHQPTFKSSFPRRIKVVKHKGSSIITRG